MALTREQLKTNINAMESQGASQSEVQEYLNTLKQPEIPPQQEEAPPDSGGGIFRRAATNAIPSGIRAIGDIFGLVKTETQAALKGEFSPTLKTIGSLGLGLAEKLIPGEQRHEQTADAVIDFYKERYGSIEKAKETFATDPVGFLLDASVVLGGAGAVVKGAGTVSKISAVQKAGTVIQKAGSIIDPLAATGRGISKVVGAGKGTRVGEAAERIGVEISAGTKTGSKVIKGAEAISEQSFLTGGRLRGLDEAARVGVAEFADNLVASAGPSASVVDIGIDIVKASDTFKQNWISVKNSLFNEVKIPPSAFVDATKTRNLLEILIKDKAQAKNILGDVASDKTLNSILSNLIKKDGTPKKVRLSEMRSAIKQLDELMKDRTNPIVTGNEAALRKVVATMADEFTAGLKEVNPDIAAKLDVANTYYKEGLDVLNSRVGDTISKLKENPSMILDSLVTGRTSVEDIKRLETIVGSELMSSVQRSVIDDILTKAKSKSTEEGFFTKAGVKSGMTRYGDKLNKLLTPEQIQALEDIDILAKTLKPSTQSSLGQIKTALAKFSPLSIGFINPLYAVGAFLGRETFVALISNKAVQKALTAGEVVAFGKVNVVAVLNDLRNPAFQFGRLNEALEEETVE